MLPNTKSCTLSTVDCTIWYMAVNWSMHHIISC